MGAIINEVQPYANNPATKKGRLRAIAITMAEAIPKSRDAKITGRGPKRSEKYPAGTCTTAIVPPIILRTTPICTASVFHLWRANGRKKINKPSPNPQMNVEMATIAKLPGMPRGIFVSIRFMSLCSLLFLMT
jgi:hypothetical protein